MSPMLCFLEANPNLTSQRLMAAAGPCASTWISMPGLQCSVKDLPRYMHSNNSLCISWIISSPRTNRMVAGSTGLERAASQTHARLPEEGSGWLITRFISSVDISCVCDRFFALECEKSFFGGKIREIGRASCRERVCQYV